MKIAEHSRQFYNSLFPTFVSLQDWVSVGINSLRQAIFHPEGEAKSEATQKAPKWVAAISVPESL